MEFANKTILLTGASSGIGKEIAKKLAVIECTLILTARRINLIENYLENVKNKRADILVFENDVGKKEDVSETMSKIKTKVKNNDKIDIAILNAGVGHRVTVDNFDSKLAEEIFNVNLFGIVYWVEQLLPDFINNREGMIVGISSLADNRGYTKNELYCASKAAASIFLEGLRVQMKQYGVKVLTVKPGFVKTPMTDKNKNPMPFLMTADKAANKILRGIEKEKRIIQFPLPITIFSKLSGALPAGVYDFLVEKFDL